MAHACSFLHTKKAVWRTWLRLPFFLCMTMWWPTARASVRQLYAVRTPMAWASRSMMTSPFRPTTPLLLQATQPKEMTMPVVVGCGLVGAYV